MIRTVKVAKALIFVKTNGVCTQECVDVVANNEKEVQTHLNKIYGRGKSFIQQIKWCERVYEMNDEFFFTNATLTKDTSKEENAQA